MYGQLTVSILHQLNPPVAIQEAALLHYLVHIGKQLLIDIRNFSTYVNVFRVHHGNQNRNQSAQISGGLVNQMNGLFILFLCVCNQLIPGPQDILQYSATISGMASSFSIHPYAPHSEQYLRGFPSGVWATSPPYP